MSNDALDPGGTMATHQDGGRAAQPPRRLVELDRAEALHLLGSVSLGRVVFTQRALPAIRPVNHILDDGNVIILTHLGAAIGGAARDGVVVAYEADEIDPVTHLGWSVVVTGLARPVTDPDQLTHYRQRLRPWIDRPMNQAIAISADVVTGFTVQAPTPPGTLSVPEQPAPPAGAVTTLARWPRTIEPDASTQKPEHCGPGSGAGQPH